MRGQRAAGPPPPNPAVVAVVGGQRGRRSAAFGPPRLGRPAPRPRLAGSGATGRRAPPPRRLDPGGMWETGQRVISLWGGAAIKLWDKAGRVEPGRVEPGRGRGAPLSPPPQNHPPRARRLDPGGVALRGPRPAQLRDLRPLLHDPLPHRGSLQPLRSDSPPLLSSLLRALTRSPTLRLHFRIAGPSESRLSRRPLHILSLLPSQSRLENGPPPPQSTVVRCFEDLDR